MREYVVLQRKKRWSGSFQITADGPGRGCVTPGPRGGRECAERACGPEAGAPRGRALAERRGRGPVGQFVVVLRR